MLIIIPNRIACAFDDKYVKNESCIGEKLTIHEYLRNIRSHPRDIIDNLKNLFNEKFIWQ